VAEYPDPERRTPACQNLGGSASSRTPLDTDLITYQRQVK
jgi:hypothetical protein